ncbi:hypothetical protein [Chryseobacterium caseinilyticum]|uniref:Uncharacterized protein n=1 Tax=Chryseobacterium caseinilyticum TaxID=2771428 RepID=A0ABR8ZAL4_9FLAO|nr:hypothetical protein [Chryseobacterium caseinilyticum]MBD8081821.1 hypothetical protein [Chryseobacterium caseinilyticum]
MKKILLSSLLAFSVVTFAQKVKFKRDQVFIDEKLAYNVEDTGTSQVISDLKGNEIFSILPTTYTVPKTTPLARNEPSTWTKVIYTVRFLESGKELLTDLRDKDIIKGFYKSNIIDENGVIDEDKIDIFINKYNNENLRSKLGNTSQSSTVIIQDSRPRNGVNISLGR